MVSINQLFFVDQCLMNSAQGGKEKKRKEKKQESCSRRAPNTLMRPRADKRGEKGEEGESKRGVAFFRRRDTSFHFPGDRNSQEKGGKKEGSPPKIPAPRI